MTETSVGTPGLALVCDFDGTVTDVPWDDLGLANRAAELSHFACVLDPDSVQKGLALFLFVKENGAAFGWELNVNTDGKPRQLTFTGAVLRDKVLLLAADATSEAGQVYDGLSHVINEQVNAIRSLNKITAGHPQMSAAAESVESFDRKMVQDLLHLNNRLVNAERDLARKNSELKRLSTVLSKDLHLAHRVVQCSGEAVVVADRDRRIVDINQAFTSITGFARHEVLHTVLHVSEPTHHDAGFLESVWEQVATRGNWQGECVGRRRNGEAFPKWLSLSTVPDDRGDVGHYVATFSDITRLKNAEERWQHLAFYDSLTHLPNRVLFKDRLRQEFARAERAGETPVLLFIDLDDFKMVNDSLGHDAGDELLCQAARRIETCVRDEDWIARLGGDEFTVVVSGCPTEIDVMDVCDRIIATFSTPFLVGDQSVRIGASIGVARYPSDGADPDTLTKHADVAMYAAKGDGRNTSRFYSRSLGERISRHLQVKTQIAQGLQRDEFRVYLQPEVSLETGAIVAVEALLRWQHPTNGLILPDQFVPVAEDSGLIVELGEFVIAEAIRMVKALRQTVLPDVRIAVNVSRRQLASPDFTRFVVTELATQQVPGSALIVELTESMAMGNMEHTVEVLETLREHGVAAAIDDFGTGYSSLTSLRQLPVECLKIDRSFVADADTSRGSESIVRAIAAMARSLELVTVAEGVERESQRELLRDAGCSIAQGYLFGQPRSFDAMMAWLSPRR